MTDNSNISRHVSYEQVKLIIDFMGQHVDFARGSLRSLEARHTSKTLWNELTKILDSSRSGTRKTSDGWSKYWSDFKNKLKNKVSLIKKTNRLGPSSERSVKSLTRLEKRALVILGPHFERKICKGSPDFINKIVSNNYPPKVKLEAINENGHHNLDNNLSESSDKQSDSDGSGGLNENFGDDSDGDSNEPIIQSIYPKWLIEVEKKRAEADLTRAKAEEHRAKIAERNAEAALIQAQALKKLADAANKQADALTKISTLMESRSSRDVIMPI